MNAVCRPQSKPQNAPSPTAPRHTDLQPFVDVFRAALAEHAASGMLAPQPNAHRDEALQSYRAVLQAQIEHDLAFNLDALSARAAAVSGKRFADVREVPVIADGFRRLERLQAYLHGGTGDEHSSVEEERWVALQQFYCDAVDLAERLFDLEQGRRRWFAPTPRSDGVFKRYNFLGIESYSWWQTAGDAAEVAIPNTSRMRFWRTLGPTIAHMLRHQVLPWGGLQWCDFERTTLGWLGRSGLGRLRGSPGRGVRFVGLEHLQGNDMLFDAETGRAHHNIVIAASHRAGFLDFPLFARPLQRIPHFVWANNAFYTPGMARKMARSRTAIPIRGFGKMRMRDALDLSVRNMSQEGMPLFIMADGSQPNMMYGYQVRVKRGVRVVVDECLRQTRSAGKRTFVLPITFDDPLGYLQGLDDELIVTVHAPLEITEPSTDQPYLSVFDESRWNGGDDLINHLEALYSVNCMQVRHGLRTPNVLDTVERKRRTAQGWGPRAWIRARLNTPIFDLQRP